MKTSLVVCRIAVRVMWLESARASRHFVSVSVELSDSRTFSVYCADRKERSVNPRASEATSMPVIALLICPPLWLTDCPVAATDKRFPESLTLSKQSQLK